MFVQLIRLHSRYSTLIDLSGVKYLPDNPEFKKGVVYTNSIVVNRQYINDSIYKGKNIIPNIRLLFAYDRICVIKVVCAKEMEKILTIVWMF